MRPDPDLIAAFAPTGVLRASINLGNPILANRGEDGQPFGVSVDLANALAQRLDLPLQLVVVDAAGKSVEVVSSEEADVGFFAIDPKRAATIHFTAPYVLIEGWYLVRDASPVRSNAEVDIAGNRVAVGKGSAYDLFLTRELKAAQIVRAPTSPTVVQAFLEQGLEVAAGVRQQLEADAAKHPGLRLLDERFMVIRQAMGLPQSRGSAAAAYLHAFVEEMKASGLVAQALARHQIAGASVAPAEAAA
ncbi:ABC transporter substrate-binding protein [Cupriavidus sp. TA19]|uniref:ABC transporter substrate-binding protein n=1 Tax=unclassified Cupriavidus TaxID=2640874 RepID=UPI000E2ED229|nr:MULTISPECIES: ABC transporter substrate-binding protein [unclassified Cupriavidus]BDB24143.1 ABC transporter substrate-binding protein [Cupriavidus sp. P-10]GLC97638.1 ABC transporter substrate-binding protein [Cupriavidus sp. TA19]